MNQIFPSIRFFRLNVLDLQIKWCKKLFGLLNFRYKHVFIFSLFPTKKIRNLYYCSHLVRSGEYVNSNLKIHMNLYHLSRHQGVLCCNFRTYSFSFHMFHTCMFVYLKFYLPPVFLSACLLQLLKSSNFQQSFKRNCY